MVKVTKTLGPLHFEDLEPHRFEDLVRQLAHGFRRWRVLEATGRLGNDEGVDIRGVEVVAEDSDVSAEEDTEEATDSAPVPVEREWIFQCKRAKEIEPKDAENDVPPGSKPRAE